jgi:hypothetical protein
MVKDHGVKPHNIDPYQRDTQVEDSNLDNFICNWGRFQNKLTVFLGAGASVGARNRDGEPMPAAIGLRDELWRAFMCDAAGRAAFTSDLLGMMSLEHAAALVEARAGRGELRDHVVQRFRTERPLWHHTILPLLGPKAMFTVNYDELVEQGWRAHAGQPPKELVLRHRPDGHPADKVPLFKPHGTLDVANERIGHGGLVITMFDYYQMIGDYQAMLEKFLADLSQRCVLFIGYAFMDMDIGAEIWRLRQRNKDIPWYAVFPRGDPDVKRMFEEKFGIRQINRTAHNFIADLDEAVDFIHPAWKLDQLQELQAKGLIQ